MTNTNPQTSLDVHRKDTKKRPHLAQRERVYLALYKEPKTMLMVSVETGILRANICRFIAKWERCNTVEMVRKGICPISKRRAGFYTTNPELFPYIIELEKTGRIWK